MTLHEALAARVSAWRVGGYTHDVYPAIGEILEWAHGDEASGNVRFLRPPQLLALETYWYLRLVEGTPHVLDLYRRCFPTSSELLSALGLDHSDLKTRALDLGVDGLLDAIRTDDGLVKKYKLDAVRETLILVYRRTQDEFLRDDFFQAAVLHKFTILGAACPSRIGRHILKSSGWTSQISGTRLCMNTTRFRSIGCGRSL